MSKYYGTGAVEINPFPGFGKRKYTEAGLTPKQQEHGEHVLDFHIMISEDLETGQRKQDDRLFQAEVKTLMPKEFGDLTINNVEDAVIMYKLLQPFPHYGKSNGLSLIHI